MSTANYGAKTKLNHKELMLKLRRYRQMDRYRRSDRYFRYFNSDAVKNRGRSSREVQANRDQKQNGSTRLPTDPQ